jgi:hypothetical protein
MTPEQLSTIFNELQALQRKGYLTQADIEIWYAEQAPPLNTRKDPEEKLKEVLRKFFTIYGINPSVQFNDPEFKRSYLQELKDLLIKYFATISPEALSLAIELNMINHFQLPKTVSVYGDRVTADFFVQVLQAYRTNKGKSLAKVEKYIPRVETPAPDPEDLENEISEMLKEDIAEFKYNGKLRLRMPRQYYMVLVKQGAIPEDLKEQHMSEAKRVHKSISNQARIRSHSPESLKELDMLRAFSGSTEKGAQFQIENIAMESAIINLITTNKL